jgi:hypothetical protein
VNPGAPITLEDWLQRLPKQPATMLRAIADAAPGGLTREDVAGRSGYSLSSSTWGPSLQTLKRNHLVVEQDGRLWLSDEVVGGVR